MSRNIILLSDGTGNAASKVWRTNVWRFFKSLDLTKASQIACYDDGVGTSAFKPLAVLGGAFGWGLKRNVLDLYLFLCRNYQPGDNVYALGFSRGAFTVRVLMGLVGNQGLVQASSEAELQQLARGAYRAYRAERFHTVWHIETIFRGIRDILIGLKNRATGAPAYSKRDNLQVEEIRFLGVWDTVSAYGLPIDEMTRGVSLFLFPMEFRDRRLSDKVKRACHALALDDERTTFHPVLWTEEGEKLAPPTNGNALIKDERISQVWFPGVHSNVGGGYPDDSLANVSLSWMMREAELSGLKFKSAPNDDPDALKQSDSARDKDGRLYDSRQGLGGYYRYGPRKIELLCDMEFSKREDDSVKISMPKIHQSVFERTLNGAHVYGPIGLPAKYAVVTEAGEILPPTTNRKFETEAHAQARASGQEAVWNLVWFRRVVYFATLAASFHLVLFPLLYQTVRSNEYSTPVRIVSEAIRLAGAFIPSFFDWWLNAFAANPRTFLVAVGILGALLYLGTSLGVRITDNMRTIWRSDTTAIPNLPYGVLYRMRTSRPYQWALWLFKRWLIPIVSVAAILYFIVASGSHLLFNLADGAGLICKSHAAPIPLAPGKEQKVERSFKPSDGCWSSGILLTEGDRYEVTIKQTSPNWTDGSPWNTQFETDVAGFEIAELPSLRSRVIMWFAVPLRRVILRPWLRIIGRIGEVGTDEYFFDPPRPSSAMQTKIDELSVTFRPRRDGELFLYVNEAVLAVPGRWDVFYRTNQGEADVRIRRLLR